MTRILLDGLAFPEPASAFAIALEAAGLLARGGDSLFLNPATTDFTQQPYVEQVRTLLGGFIQASQWVELDMSGQYLSVGDTFTSGRSWR